MSLPNNINPTILISIIGVLITFTLYLFDRIKHKRTLRKELTDTIEKLINITIEKNNSIFNYKTKSSNDEFDKADILDRTYNAKRIFLVNHVIFLMKQIPNFTTSNDYRIVSQTMLNYGDKKGSLKFIQEALSKCTNTYDYILISKSLATSLIQNNQIEKGRKTLKELIEKLKKKEGYEYTIYNIWTFWASNELNYTDGSKIPYIIENIEACISNSKSYTVKGMETKLLNIKVKYADKNNHKMNNNTPTS